MPVSDTHILLDAILDQGTRLIEALAEDDFERAVDCVKSRGALIARLPAPGTVSDAVRGARLAQQDRLLAEQAQQAYTRLAEALRRTGQFQYASDSYAPAPHRTRLQARG